MRFECSVALKYLLPKKRQISASIISLISIAVISLVVWLVIVFLSVTDGMEKKWKSELVALNAPLRISPTDAYYRSYYYLIDSISQASGYMTKTIGEKNVAEASDPYDPEHDMELSSDFPLPDVNEEGKVKDLVKECWNSVQSLEKKYPGIRAKEYEVAFGNLRLNLLRNQNSKCESAETCLTQLSYISSYDEENPRFRTLILPPSIEDISNFLQVLQGHGQDAALSSLLEKAHVMSVATPVQGYLLPPSLYPKEGALHGYGVVERGVVKKIFISESDRMELPQAMSGSLIFSQNKAVSFQPDSETGPILISPHPTVILGQGFHFKASHIPGTTRFRISGKLKDAYLEGETEIEPFEIKEAHPGIEFSSSASPPLWVHRKCDPKQKETCVIPTAQGILGDGILIPKTFKNNGVRLGDRGFLSYFTGSASTAQEQKLPIYVAGFYDPGLIPVGSKLILADRDVVSLLRGNFQVADKMLGNGIQVWVSNIDQVEALKSDLTQELKKRGIDSFWNIESYLDYEFARPILQQLQSDKTLFTLIALIILTVACSNIISMLILLVNDKKREIGILQSMGATPGKIAAVFGLCGCFTGIASSVLGTAAALITLHYLQSLVDLLSFFQGHDAFQSAFYGSHLPNELSMGAFMFALSATIVISILAGVVPALKASKIRPSEILRSE